MLEIKGLSVSVAGKEILKDFSLSVAAGEVHAIMGPNGSGKSTLSYVLAGREGYDITAGSVLYRGQDLFALEPEMRAREASSWRFNIRLRFPVSAAQHFSRQRSTRSASIAEKKNMTPWSFSKSCARSAMRSASARR